MDPRYGHVAPEPFEEEWRTRNASNEQTTLTNFYQEQEQRDIVRKQSGKRRSSGSIWRRKSTKDAQPPGTHPGPSTSSIPAPEREMQAIEDAAKVSAALPNGSSIVPEVMRDVPTWYTKDHSAPVPFNIRYTVHNPVGPRRYRNHHLISPAESRPEARPPSFFSPDFPPMASSSSVRLEDTSRPPARIASMSPAPTPSSSQIRVGEQPKPRSRKTSQTPADPVDLLDGSDPWGQNFHHQSPYDVKTNENPTEGQNSSQTRSRHSSMTAPSQRHRAVTPSPLSQSTSAVHLRGTADPNSRPPSTRKLSKRRTGLGFLTGRSVSAGSMSAPSTPVTSTAPDDLSYPPSKRESRVGPPPSNPAAFAAATKKDRRGSVFGRLAKKLSIYRKSTTDPSDPASGRTSRQSQIVQMEEMRPDDARLQDQKLQPLPGPTPSRPSNSRSPSPQKRRRVPPPEVPPEPEPAEPEPAPLESQPMAEETSLHPPTPLPPQLPTSPPEPMFEPALPRPPASGRIADKAPRVSIASLDEMSPFSLGQLTVANPDLASADNTPVQKPVSLPVDTPPAPEARRADKRLSQVVRSNPIQLPNGARPADPFALQSNAAAYPQPPSQTQRSRSPVKRSGSRSPTKRSGSRSPTKLQKPQPRPPSPEKPTVSSPRPITSRRHSVERRSKRGASPTQRPPSVEKTGVHSPRPSASRRQSEERRSKRSASPIKRASAAVVAAAIALQHNLQPPPQVIPAAGSSIASSPTGSSSSVLANAPSSPYPTIPDLPSTPSTIPPPLPEKEVKAPSIPKRPSYREPSPGGLNRSTETFKMVRSASGTVYASSETIHADGGQWEVVESESRQKEPSRSKDTSGERSSPSKRERERAKDQDVAGKRESQRRSEKEVERAKEKEQERLRKHQSADFTSSSRSSSSKHGRRTSSMEVRDSVQHPSQEGPAAASSRKRSDRAREREEEKERERGRDRKSSRKSVDYTHQSQQSRLPAAPTQPPIQSGLQRAPSTSTRPTSEMFPAAEMNDLRAREAWDLERLYKGRSMYGEEVRDQGPASPPPPPLPAKDTRHSIQSHGSSHTSFMLQTPFQQPAAPAPAPTLPPRHPRRSSAKPSVVDVFPKGNNPLPPPPAESTYQPSMMRDSDPKSAQYWAQYAGVTTTAH